MCEDVFVQQEGVRYGMADGQEDPRLEILVAREA